jgi:hypothetical protein
LQLLYEKINLFQLVIGELDTIVEDFAKKAASLESKVYQIVLESTNPDEMRHRLQSLGEEWVRG